MNIGRKIMPLFVLGLALLLIILTVIISLSQAPHVGGKRPIIFDGKIIHVLENISKIVPKNETIITPNFTPIVKYFTSREVYTPYDVSSYNALVSLMRNDSYNYLLLFENQSDVNALIHIVQKDNMPKLSKDFKEIGTYTTEFSRLHLYTRIS